MLVFSLYKITATNYSYIDLYKYDGLLIPEGTGTRQGELCRQRGIAMEELHSHSKEF